MSNLDSLAVSNYGYNFGMNPMSMQNYGYYNLYADPSWQNYWQWSQQMDTINAQNQALTLNNNPAQNTNNLTFGQNPTITNTNTTNPTTSAQPEKKKGKGKALLLTVGALAVAGTWFLASKGKSQGATGLLNQVKAGWNNIGKKGISNAIKLQEVNGQKIVSLPKQNQCLNIRNNTVEKITDKAQKLGFNINQNLNLADDAAKLKSTQFEFTLGDKTYNGIFRDGKIAGLKDGATKLEIDTLDTNLKEKVDDILNALNTSKNAPGGVTLRNTLYGAKFDGGEALYMANAGEKNGFRVFRTNRYEINDNTLLVLRGQNQKLNEGIIQAQKGNLESWGICDGLWTPKGSKTYFGLGSEKPIKGVLTGNNWKDDIQLVIKDDKIFGFTKDGGKTIFNSNTENFQALLADFPEVFEKALEHKSEFVNPVMYFKG